MKRIITLLFGIAFSLVILNSQEAPPQAFSFKASIMDSKGNPVPLRNVRMRISIIPDNIGGVAVYSEYFLTKTNVYSQVDLEIGRGTPEPLSGMFSSIDWSANEYFLKVEVDIKGGTDYLVLSTTQLLSVPYALYAQNAGSAVSITETDPIFRTSPAGGISSSDIANWNSASGWGNHADLYRLKDYVPSWSEITSKPFDFTAPSLDQLLKYNGTSWVNFTPSFLISEVDGDITNEIQTLSLTNNELSISKTEDNKIIFDNWDIDARDDVTLSGDQSIGGNKNFTGTTTVQTPINETDAVTKAYVDALESRILTLEAQVAALLASGNDADGDGYSAYIDCDDSNVDIHPGAEEICGDGIDQDCNGSDLTCNYSESCLPSSEDPISSMIRLINLERIEHGLEPLAPDPRLAQAAQGHAVDMAETGILSHTGSDGSTFLQRCQNAGYSGPCGEVIGILYSSASSLLSDWMGEPEVPGEPPTMHAQIILGNFRHIGVGNSGTAWVVDFGGEAGGPSCIEGLQDADQDGYSVTDGDCDDNNSSINPGATEIPGNDIDENCNGFVSCFIDGDNDGYGSNSVATDCYPATNGHSLVTNVCGSSNTDGFDDTAFDCNDADETINRLGIEICDGRDNNCDGRVDEGCTSIDGDGDGFTSTAGDCDDNNPAIYPGANEIIGDGIDQDCDGVDQISLPSSFDWRSYNGSNWMTSVKNQGSCGSCFAVATVAAFEAKIKIQSNRPELVIDLSEQEILSCGNFNNPCGGGAPTSALNYIRDNGIVEESVFPYTSGSGIVPPCMTAVGQDKYKIVGWEMLPYSMDPNEIKKTLINKGPIIFLTYASSIFFDYNGGILLPPDDYGSIVNKTMLLIGYNDTERYWIVENTWDSWWGEDGFYRLSYDATAYSIRDKFVINGVSNN